MVKILQNVHVVFTLLNHRTCKKTKILLSRNCSKKNTYIKDIDNSDKENSIKDEVK
jgi:hypothetical protein